jgi:hypothetical protein
VAAGWDADRYQRQFGFVLHWRLRFVAVAGDEVARTAKLHRQMAGDRDR